MDNCGYQHKESLYKEVLIDSENGNSASKRGFQCLVCSRTLSSKQRVLEHLHGAHSRSEYNLLFYTFEVFRFATHVIMKPNSFKQRILSSRSLEESEEALLE